jgi:DnaJ-class molecular chaperone
MRDPYEVLGVERNASAERIRQAYRGLAKTSHPDLHPGDRKAEERFKEISAAYDLLGDEAKRGQYDRGEIDADGNPRVARPGPGGGFGFGRGFSAGAGGNGGGGQGFEHASDLEDMIQELFGSRRRGGFQARGADVRYRLEIGLADVARGGKRTVTLADGGSVDVTLPEGVESGQVLRLRGKGASGAGGGPPGDALVEIVVRPHPRFERKGADVHLALPVTLGEAVGGGRVNVPTLHGPVAMTIPKGSSTGAVLRLRGKGLPRAGGGPAGDQYVRLEVALPPAPDQELGDFVRRWEAAHPYDPRRDLARDTGG